MLAGKEEEKTTVLKRGRGRTHFCDFEKSVPGRKGGHSPKRRKGKSFFLNV